MTGGARRQDGVATAKEIHSLIFSCIAAAAAAQKAAGGALHECANAISYYKLGLRVRWMMEFVSTFQNGIPLKKKCTHIHTCALIERESSPSHSRSRQQNSWKCRRDIFHSRGDLFVMMAERAPRPRCFCGELPFFFLFALHTCQGLDQNMRWNFTKEDYSLHLQLNHIYTVFRMVVLVSKKHFCIYDSGKCYE